MDIKKDNAMYMRIAHIAAERSYARRLKVGCVIVKNHSIISFGWNGHAITSEAVRNFWLHIWTSTVRRKTVLSLTAAPFARRSHCRQAKSLSMWANHTLKPLK